MSQLLSKSKANCIHDTVDNLHGLSENGNIAVNK